MCYLHFLFSWDGSVWKLGLTLFTYMHASNILKKDVLIRLSLIFSFILFLITPFLFSLEQCLLHEALVKNCTYSTNLHFLYKWIIQIFDLINTIINIPTWLYHKIWPFPIPLHHILCVNNNIVEINRQIYICSESMF